MTMMLQLAAGLALLAVAGPLVTQAAAALGLPKGLVALLESLALS